MDLELLLADGARSLSAAWGRPVLLTEPQVLRTQSRCDVVRARVRGGDVPTVILKHFREDPVLGLDEWTGLELLGRHNLTTAPGLIAGDIATRLFVLEDLGTGPSLEDLFNASDARAATGGLLAVARITGQMHARTLRVRATSTSSATRSAPGPPACASTTRATCWTTRTGCCAG